MIKPRFPNLWQEFPPHTQHATLKDLFTALGGAAAKNIDLPGFGATGNTCAARLSVAFNKSGAPILQSVADAAGARTVGAADGSRLIFGVADFRRYLLHTLGQPSVDNASPYNDAFSGRTGIIAFRVNWGNASGHIALWNGRMFREPKYDDFSAYVSPQDAKIRTSLGEFWELT